MTISNYNIKNYKYCLIVCCKMKRTAKPFFVVGGGEVLADIMNFF
jgi:hypothetical protein